jgi:predicted permease
VSFAGDIVQAARTLFKARAFTLVCVLSLGVGMGVVIAIFLLIRLLTATPPGVNGAGLAELVIRPSGQLRAQAGSTILDTWSYPDYLDLRAAVNGMSVTGWSRGEALIVPPGQLSAIAMPAIYVSSNYFATIGVTLPRGPGFTASDDASTAPAEAVLSYRAWQVRFGADPNIIGRAITINQTEYVVAGVAPDGFRGHVSSLDEGFYALWLPLSRHPRLLAKDSPRLNRDAAWLRLLARLSPQTTLSQADAMVSSAMAGLAARYPSSNQDKAGGAEKYFAPGARMRTQVSIGRAVLFGVSGMVLLVVGLNISGMMLVRSAMREKELAIRMAIGAGRWRLMRYHLSEALVLAVFGGALASALLFGVPRVLAWAYNSNDPTFDLLAPDLWIALECVALCFVTSLVLGLLPAIRFSRPIILAALKSDSAGGRRVGRLQRFTAAAQAGLAVPFLVMCGVELDMARAVLFADTGFTPPGLYAASVNLPGISTSDAGQRRFLEAMQDTLAQAPGVTAVSVGDGLPLDFIYRDTRIAREGQSTFFASHSTSIGEGYFEAIGTRILAGRAIDNSDRDGAERVVMLSEPLARELFPSGDPLGQRVMFALGGNEQQTYTVVGITADLVSTQMGNPRPQLFVSLAQHPASTVMVIARGTPSDPSMRAAFEAAIGDGVRVISSQADPKTVFRTLVTGEWLIQNSRSDFLTSSAVGGGAAGIALVLAALGVYGVIAFMVATRTREIGVRVALGASRSRVLREVLGDALMLVIPGIAVGLVLGALWVRFGEQVWLPLGGAEPFVYAAAAAIAFAVAVLAGIPSARRAAAVQPMVAMRAE